MLDMAGAGELSAKLAAGSEDCIGGWGSGPRSVGASLGREALMCPAFIMLERGSSSGAGGGERPSCGADEPTAEGTSPVALGLGSAVATSQRSSTQPTPTRASAVPLVCDMSWSGRDMGLTGFDVAANHSMGMEYAAPPSSAPAAPTATNQRRSTFFLLVMDAPVSGFTGHSALPEMVAQGPRWRARSVAHESRQRASSLTWTSAARARGR